MHHLAAADAAPQSADLPPLSLRKNFGWTSAGNLLYVASQWGMLVVLAKLGNPEMVGRFSLGFAVCTPAIYFTNLALRAVLATDTSRQYLFSDYLGLRLIMTLFALLVIAGITYAAGYRWEAAMVILAVGLAKAFEAISDVFYGLLQQHERMDRIAKSMMMKGALSLVGLTIGVYLVGSVLWGVLGLAVAWALILIGYDVRSGVMVLKVAGRTFHNLTAEGAGRMGGLKPRWEMETLRKLAWLALPLGFTTVLISLNANIPRYFIERYLGERELGIFAAMAYVMMGGDVVLNALGESARPRLAKYYVAANSAAFRTLLLKLVGIGVAVGGAGVVVALLFGRELLTTLYGSEYAEHSNVFIWLMVAAGISYVVAFLRYGMTAARFFKVQVSLFSAVLCTTTLACAFLIPLNGLLGAAQANVVFMLLSLLGAMAVNIHVLRNLRTMTLKGADK